MLCCLCVGTGLLFFFTQIFFAGGAQAQVPDLQGDTAIPLNIQLDPSDEKPSTDELLAPEEDDEKPVVDTGLDPNAKGGDGLSEEPMFFLREILLDGVTVFQPEEMGDLLTPMVGKKVSTADLGRIVSEVRQMYVKNGYVTTVCRIRPGEVHNGTIIVEVFEGRVAQRVVLGQKRTKPRMITGRITLKQGEIFDYKKLEADLVELNQNPLFKSVRAALKPGEHPATSNIELIVDEARPLSLNVSFDNGGRHLIGTYRGLFSLVHNNLTGNGDSLATTVVLSQNTRTSGVSSQYRFPVSIRHRITAGASFGLNHVDLADPFDSPADVTGISSNYSLFVEKTLKKSQRLTLTGDARLNFYDSKISVDGKALDDVLRITHFQNRRRYPVIPPPAAGPPIPIIGNPSRPNQFRQIFEFDRVRTFSYGLTAMEQDTKGRTIVRGAVEHGLVMMGGNRPFSKFNLDITRLQALPKGMIMILKGQSQFTPSNLPGLNQFQLGGANTVRGFREGFLIGDSGYFLSSELRFPLFKMPKILKDRFQGVAFFEHGHTSITGDNKDAHAKGTSDTLSSAGIGLRGRIVKNITGRVDLGFTFNRKFHQNMRVHFGLDSKLF